MREVGRVCADFGALEAVAGEVSEADAGGSVEEGVGAAGQALARDPEEAGLALAQLFNKGLIGSASNTAIAHSLLLGRALAGVGVVVE